MRAIHRLAAVPALLVSSMVAALLPAAAAEPIALQSFPPTARGFQVLAVDLHVHTIFSDAYVWPNLRVEEALNEGLAAIAITDHAETTLATQLITQPDTGLLDKNQAFVLADRQVRDGGLPLTVIPGAELTRGIGHMNCVFIQDANQMRSASHPDARSSQDVYEHFHTVGPKTEAEVEAALRRAEQQGGICFQNHPYWPGFPSYVAHPEPVHQRFFDQGLLRGIEVANGDKMFPQAIDLALKNSLAMLGNSDTHRQIKWELAANALPHRTVTLFLAKNRQAESLKEALANGRTVALYRQTLIGREADVADILGSALTMTPVQDTTRDPVRRVPRSVIVKIENKAPVEVNLELVDESIVVNQTKFLRVPAGGSVSMRVLDVDPEKFAGLRFRVLNSYISSNSQLSIPLPLQRAGY
ncbi:MAG TPA: hypothetical protein VGE08_14610 [Steroidobacter sp.]|uniref:hypothetical protein n=1 Tax=Steroidobacter sp. TaxID=1978227 RepID=UPI002EDADDF7